MAKVSFSGIGSGIDGAAVAKTLYDQLTLTNKIKQKQETAAKAETTSLQQLNKLLLDLADKVDSLRSSNGGAAAKHATSSNTAVATASTDSTAASGAFTVNVTSLAKAASGSFSRSFSSTAEAITTDPSQTGNVQFSVGSGAEEFNFDVEVTETMTSQQFVNSFNAAAGGQATASLVNIGTSAAPNYKIVFNSTDAGTEAGSISVSSDNPALLSSDVLGTPTISQASNARFTVSGIDGTIERASNTINDLVQGVSFELAGTGATTVTVQNDLKATSAQLEAIVGAFNALATFSKTENSVTSKKVDGETVNSFGSLARTNVDDDALTAIRSAISGSASANGTVSLAALGVSTQRDGTLAFDKKKFDEVFANDPAAANQAVTSLANKLGGIQGEIHRFTGFGNAIEQATRSNDTEVNNLQQSMARTERSALQREEAVKRQFSNLEGLLARLNANSSFLAGLLNF